MSALQFRVWGVAQPKGSARAFLPKGSTRPIVTSDNPSLKQWEASIREALQDVLSSTPPSVLASLFDAPVDLTLAFYLPRPKTAPRRVLYPTKRPDLDKCARGVIDALSGLAFRDDSQVVRIECLKAYALEAAYVDITIAPFTPPILQSAAEPLNFRFNERG